MVLDGTWFPVLSLWSNCKFPFKVSSAKWQMINDHAGSLAMWASSRVPLDVHSTHAHTSPHPYKCNAVRNWISQMYTYFLIYSLKSPVIIDCMIDNIKYMNKWPYISSFIKNPFALDPNQPVVRWQHFSCITRGCLYVQYSTELLIATGGTELGKFRTLSHLSVWAQMASPPHI